MKKLHTILAAAITVFGITTPALAQSIDGAVQVGVSTHFLSYTSTKLTTPTGIGGLDETQKTSVTRWGLSDIGGFQLEGGYGLNDSIVLGGLVSLGGRSFSREPSDNGLEESSLNVVLAPKIDYLFLPGSVFRPALGAAAGLVVQNTYLPNNVDLTLAGFGLMGRAGGKWFLTPGFSLDPSLFFGWQTMSGSVGFGNTSIDASLSGITVGLSVGVSGWIK